jgi:hypothetical protein
VGPLIDDLLGFPMSQAYAGAFTVALPTVSGAIADTDGQPAPGVVVRAGGGLSPAIADGEGRYALGFLPGSAFAVTPSKPGLVFLPQSRAYTNLTDSISDQDYQALSIEAPTVRTTVDNAGIHMAWPVLPGVDYHVECSTNLLHWSICGGVLITTNGVMQFPLPIDTAPAAFFRVRAGY